MKAASRPRYRIGLRWFRPLFWPFFLPVALLLALFNKISPVPFKIYLMRVDRVGHLAQNTEQVCCDIELGRFPREFRVFVYRDRPSNAFLLSMWARVLPIRQVFLPLYDILHKLGGLGVVSRALQDTRRNEGNEVESCRQHLHFLDSEIADAKRQCLGLGFDSDTPFVCVLGRDDAYLLEHNKHEDNTHNRFRNTDINTYIPAMEHLARNHAVIRMGSVARDRVRTTNPRVIDYPFSGKRTELLDVYLSASCRFFLTCGTGIDSIASLCFRLPTLYVNFIPVRYLVTFGSANITILKHYWSIAEKRFLTLSEIVESGAGESYDYYRIAKLGLEVVDNSPEEILDAVQEMEARLDGMWVDSPEDEALQRSFWNIYRRYYPEKLVVARIGAKFLRNNPHWTK